MTTPISGVSEEIFFDILMQVFNRTEEIQTAPGDVWKWERLYNTQIKFSMPGTCEALRAYNMTGAAET